MDADPIAHTLARMREAATLRQRPTVDKWIRRCRRRLRRPGQLADLANTPAEQQLLARLLQKIEPPPQSAPPPAPPDEAAEAYEQHKQRAAARQAEISRASREIGPLPDVAHPQRKAACERDLKRYAETYHAPAFPLEWSEDQLTAIRKIQVAVLAGALFALAMPRGSGKSTIVRVAIEWATLYAHSPFSLLIGASEEKADEAIGQILLGLETNPLLLEDFPEVCWPLVRIAGIHNRAKGQTLDGEPTRVEFGKRHLQLPTVAGSPASGAIIKAAGLLSAARGANHRRADGTIIRPQLVLGDDLQTRESAESPEQSAKRLRIINGDLLGMAGPRQSLAGLVVGTVIAPGDAMEQLLDREQSPEWRGERTSLLISFPDNMELWDEYDQIRRRYLVEDDDARATPKEATAFYRKHRRAMNKGAAVSWEARYREDELSAIQHAMNLYFRNEEAFWTEYQNEPRVAGSDEVFLDAAALARKTNNYARGIIPADCLYVTAYVDVHKRVLYYAICAWQQDFTGYLIDYGTWPKAARQHFTVARFRPSLTEQYAGQGTEAAIYSGLKHLTDVICEKPWQREDNVILRTSMCLVDQQWDTATVQKFCRESSHRGVVVPQVSRYIGPNEITISNYRRKTGEKIGTEWLLKRGGKGLLLCHSDANFWKTFLARRLAASVGDPGAFTLFGRESASKKAAHQTLARQLTAEHPQITTGRRTCTVWAQKPGQENHWWDCVWGCAVAASVCGATATGVEQQQRRRLRLSELKKSKSRR